MERERQQIDSSTMASIAGKLEQPRRLLQPTTKRQRAAPLSTGCTTLSLNTPHQILALFLNPCGPRSEYRREGRQQHWRHRQRLLPPLALLVRAQHPAGGDRVVGGGRRRFLGRAVSDVHRDGWFTYPRGAGELHSRGEEPNRTEHRTLQGRDGRIGGGLVPVSLEVMIIWLPVKSISPSR